MKIGAEKFKEIYLEVMGEPFPEVKEEYEEE